MGPQTASLGRGTAVPGATACRHCGAPLELTVVDLGKSPLCQTVLAIPNLRYPPPDDALALADVVLGSIDELVPEVV